MTFIVPIKRMQQSDVDTEQGSYESPFVPYSANQYLTRTPPMLQDMRGRHPYRVQPRQLGPGAMLGMDGLELVDNDGATMYPGASSPYPPMPGVQGYGEFDEYLRSVQGYGLGQTAPTATTLTNFQIAILVGIVGLAAYFLGKHMAKKARRNPVSCRRGWSGHHRAYLCAKCKGGSAPRRRRVSSGTLTSFQSKNRKLASKARQQPRDESGRFV